MRTLYFFIAVTLATFLAKRALAELVIYKGTLKQAAIGLGVSIKLNSQFYLIVVRDTGSIAGIQYATVNGSKDLRRDDRNQRPHRADKRRQRKNDRGYRAHGE